MNYHEALKLYLGDNIDIKDPSNHQSGYSIAATVVGFRSSDQAPLLLIDKRDNLGSPIDDDIEEDMGVAFVRKLEDRFYYLPNDPSSFIHEEYMGVKVGDEITVGRTGRGYVITGPNRLWDTTGKYSPLKGTVIGFKRDKENNAIAPLVVIKREEQKFRYGTGILNSQKRADIANRYAEKLDDEFDTSIYGGDAFVYLTDEKAFKKMDVDVNKDTETKNSSVGSTSKKQGETVMSNNKPAVFDMIKDDASNALYRVAATQINKGVKTAILALLERQGGNSDGLKAASEMLDTELGTNIISLLLGLGLGNIPIEKLQEDHRVQKVASELRINGMAGAGNIVMDLMMESLMPVIMETLSSLPAEATQARVIAAPNKTTEKEVYSEEEIKLPAKTARV